MLKKTRMSANVIAIVAASICTIAMLAACGRRETTQTGVAPIEETTITTSTVTTTGTTTTDKEETTTEKVRKGAKSASAAETTTTPSASTTDGNTSERIDSTTEGQRTESARRGSDSQTPETREPARTTARQTETPRQTTVATNPPATNPPQTQPPQTDPPQTDPPQTQPPQTDPPQTDPPQTQPPATFDPSSYAWPEVILGDMDTNLTNYTVNGVFYLQEFAYRARFDEVYELRADGSIYMGRLPENHFGAYSSLLYTPGCSIDLTCLDGIMYTRSLTASNGDLAVYFQGTTVYLPREDARLIIIAMVGYHGFSQDDLTANGFVGCGRAF